MVLAPLAAERSGRASAPLALAGKEFFLGLSKAYLPDSHFFVAVDYAHWRRKKSTGSVTSVASIGDVQEKLP
jgi:hypothetical protein